MKAICITKVEINILRIYLHMYIRELKLLHATKLSKTFARMNKCEWMRMNEEHECGNSGFKPVSKQIKPIENHFYGQNWQKLCIADRSFPVRPITLTSATVATTKQRALRDLWTFHYIPIISTCPKSNVFYELFDVRWEVCRYFLSDVF